MDFKAAREASGLTLREVAELVPYKIPTINKLELTGKGSRRLKDCLRTIYTGKKNIEPASQSLILHDAPPDYLVDDLLGEVQTIKESLAALERKLKKLKP